MFQVKNSWFLFSLWNLSVEVFKTIVQFIEVTTTVDFVGQGHEALYNVPLISVSVICELM